MEVWASLYLQPTTRAWVMQGQAAKQGLGTGSTCSSSNSSSTRVAQGHHSEAKVIAKMGTDRDAHWSVSWGAARYVTQSGIAFGTVAVAAVA